VFAADPIALGNHWSAVAGNMPMTGAADCQAILRHIIAAECALFDVMIFDIAREQLGGAFLALSLAAVPCDKLGAFAELNAHS
jgi:hypothetical protein